MKIKLSKKDWDNKAYNKTSNQHIIKILETSKSMIFQDQLICELGWIRNKPTLGYYSKFSRFCVLELLELK